MREYIERDPCYLLNLMALMGKPPATKHHAFIREPFKIGVLLGDILEYSGSASVKMAALFGAFTALRPANARLALWSEIDLKKDIFKIPAFKMKMKAPFDVPIAPSLKRLLLSYKALKLDEDILFPSAYKGAVLSDNAMRSMYRRLGYTKEEFSPHGWRACFSTLCNEADKNADIIELCLSHSPKDKVRAAYNHSLRIEAKRKLLSWWADVLCRLCPELLNFEF